MSVSEHLLQFSTLDLFFKIASYSKKKLLWRHQTHCTIWMSQQALYSLNSTDTLHYAPESTEILHCLPDSTDNLHCALEWTEVLYCLPDSSETEAQQKISQIYLGKNSGRHTRKVLGASPQYPPSHREPCLQKLSLLLLNKIEARHAS